MTESHVERVHTEPVVLNIGEDVGALIIYTDEERCGDEIELSRTGDARRFHNQVHERSFDGRSVFAAVYPDLRAGGFDLWDHDSRRAGSVTIVGGQVATVDWRDSGRRENP